jgi:hypothetical protein
VTDEDIHKLVEHIVVMLAQRDYSGVAAFTGEQRLSEKEIARAIAEYPYHPVVPPRSEFEHLISIVPVARDGWKEYSVWVTLWSLEEGKSDLGLRVTVFDKGNNERDVRLDGILVS